MSKDKFVKPYGGRRKAGQNVKGGYFSLSNPWTFRFLPGIAVGYFLKHFFDQNKLPRGRKLGGEAVKLGGEAVKLDVEAKPKPVKPKAQTAPPFPAGTKLKMVMIVRGDLGMGNGKVAAQCSHATLGIYKSMLASNKPLLTMWEKQGQPKIVLRCKDLVELNTLSEEARRLDLKTFMVSDAGHTQVAAGSVTVLAIGPGPDSVVDSVAGHLKLL